MFTSWTRNCKDLLKLCTRTANYSGPKKQSIVKEMEWFRITTPRGRRAWRSTCPASSSFSFPRFTRTLNGRPHPSSWIRSCRPSRLAYTAISAGGDDLSTLSSSCIELPVEGLGSSSILKYRPRESQTLRNDCCCTIRGSSSGTTSPSVVWPSWPTSTNSGVLENTYGVCGETSFVLASRRASFWTLETGYRNWNRHRTRSHCLLRPLSTPSAPDRTRPNDDLPRKEWFADSTVRDYRERTFASSFG